MSTAVRSKPLSAKKHAAIQACQPRPFIVWRYKDVTGISGDRMKVAEGVLFSSGWAVVHWLPTRVRNQPKTECWYNPGVDPFKEISGHDGLTVVLFLDEGSTPT